MFQVRGRDWRRKHILRPVRTPVAASASGATPRAVPSPTGLFRAPPPGPPPPGGPQHCRCWLAVGAGCHGPRRAAWPAGNLKIIAGIMARIVGAVIVLVGSALPYAHLATGVGGKYASESIFDAGSGASLKCSFFAAEPIVVGAVAIVGGILLLVTRRDMLVTIVAVNIAATIVTRMSRRVTSSRMPPTMATSATTMGSAAKKGGPGWCDRRRRWTPRRTCRRRRWPGAHRAAPSRPGRSPRRRWP